MSVKSVHCMHLYTNSPSQSMHLCYRSRSLNIPLGWALLQQFVRNCGWLPGPPHWSYIAGFVSDPLRTRTNCNSRGLSQDCRVGGRSFQILLNAVHAMWTYVVVFRVSLSSLDVCLAVHDGTCGASEGNEQHRRFLPILTKT